MKIRTLIFVASTFLIYPCFAGEEIKIWVGSSAYSGLFSKITEPFEKTTGIKLDYQGLTKTTKSTAKSPDYFKDVIAGKVDAAVVTITFEDWVELTKKEGVKIPENITYRVVGHDLVNVYTHPTVGIKELSLSQLDGLFSGRISNWKEIGGADIPVTLVISPEKPSTNTGFRKRVMGGRDFQGRILKATSYEDVANKIAETPGAISFGPESMNSERIRIVQGPAIGLPATMITLGKPNKNVQALIDYIRDHPIK